MRVSELLGSTAFDADGVRVGTVRDVRLIEGGAESGESFAITGLVIGDGFLAAPAHAWGFVEGRARGPALLRLLFARAVRGAVYVEAGSVASWGPGTLRLRVRRSELSSWRSASA